ncbi:hypothetical protein GTP38_00430 [Duganella sp. FT94W]|uniref:DUF4435 domain-containing protein n=1 Tax=Duganella lactea TaxID=2692173 RepID=A0ABW9UZ82_9BURK|nr:hypothetical protein [Duganella lactea]MYM32816.1 hypothetical protein [Duganella lactea]
MNISLIFVVEGKNDAILLRKVLQLCMPHVSSRFFAAQGKIMLASVARNIAADLRSPVMIIGDTDSLDKAEVRHFRNDHIKALSTLLPSNMIDAFAFSPDLDTVIAEATQIEIKGLKRDKVQALQQAIGKASESQLGADPQLESFLQAVESLWAVITPAQQLVAPPATMRTSAGRSS